MVSSPSHFPTCSCSISFLGPKKRKRNPIAARSGSRHTHAELTHARQHTAHSTSTSTPPGAGWLLGPFTLFFFFVFFPLLNLILFFFHHSPSTWNSSSLTRSLARSFTFHPIHRSTSFRFASLSCVSSSFYQHPFYLGSSSSFRHLI
jgi:hypothetical protein